MKAFARLSLARDTRGVRDIVKQYDIFANANERYFALQNVVDRGQVRVESFCKAQPCPVRRGAKLYLSFVIAREIQFADEPCMVSEIRDRKNWVKAQPCERYARRTRYCKTIRYICKCK